MRIEIVYLTYKVGLNKKYKLTLCVKNSNI